MRRGGGETPTSTTRFGNFGSEVADFSYVPPPGFGPLPPSPADRTTQERQRARVPTRDYVQSEEEEDDSGWDSMEIDDPMTQEQWAQQQQQRQQQLAQQKLPLSVQMKLFQRLNQFDFESYFEGVAAAPQQQHQQQRRSFTFGGVAPAPNREVPVGSMFPIL